MAFSRIERGLAVLAADTVDQRPFAELLRLAEPGLSGISLGEAVAERRKELGISQEELAQERSSVRTIDRLERGQVDSSISVYREILRVLGMGESRYRKCP